LLEYYRAWIGGVLQDGRYQPGVYAAKSNATILYDAAVTVCGKGSLLIHTMESPRFTSATSG